MSRTSPERDGAATRERILEAAERAFAQRGFSGTNLAEIATAVGIRKASLYYYFPTKNELYAEVFRGITANLGGMVQAAMGHEGTPVEQIDYLVDAFVDFAAVHEHFAVMAFRELADSHLDLGPLLTETAHPILEAVVAWIRVGQERGIFKPVEPVHFLMSCVGMVLFWFSASPGLLTRYLDEDPVGPARVAIVKAETKRTIHDAILATPEESTVTTTPPSRIFAPGLFEGQTAFITGGGTGIGLAIARELGRLGARVAIASRKPEHIEPAAESLCAEGIDCHPAIVDIRDPERVAAVVAELVARWGRIDILVNNAGGQFPAPAATFTPNGWNAVINTNLNGPWYVTQQVATQAMIPQMSGRIVSIVADMWRGFPGMAHTGAARAAIVNLTKTLSVEWACFGIKVNAVAPGVIESSGFQRYPEEIRKTRWRKIPLKRLGTEEEVAWMVTYLVSPAGDYVTGTTFRLDGGASLWGEILDIPDPDEPPTAP